MTEFFLPFLIGYTTARILSFLLSSNRQTSHDLDSVLLKWDNSVFGWRAVSFVNEGEKNQRYMVARPVSRDLISAMIAYRKNSDQ